jgi:hypothetical protein
VVWTSISSLATKGFSFAAEGVVMKWFRFWTDTLDDIKILQLSDYEYRMWTYLLAMVSEVNSMSGECHVNVKSMSLRCRTQVNHFLKALETFQSIGLITINNEGYPVVTNWNKRQYKSDDVTARVNKHREVTNKRNVSCNVSETDQITDTDTDTEKNIKEGGILPPVPSLKNKPPKNKSIPPAIEDVIAYCFERNNNVDPEGWMAFYNSNGWMVGKNKMRDWRSAIITWEKRGGNGNGKPNTNIRSGDRPSVYAGQREEIEAINREYRAGMAKQAAIDKARGDAEPDDVPDFQSS